MVDNRSQQKAAFKNLAKIPMDIKDLSNFNAFEINAITRRNTIKNKLVGRQKIKEAMALVSEAAKEDLEQNEKEIPLNKTVSESVSCSEWAKPEEDFGMSSIYSKSSVETESSVSWLSTFKSILKSGVLRGSEKVKSVTFSI